MTQRSRNRKEPMKSPPHPDKDLTPILFCAKSPPIFAHEAGMTQYFFIDTINTIIENKRDEGHLSRKIYIRGQNIQPYPSG
jgi:hypothetical protein